MIYVLKETGKDDKVQKRNQDIEDEAKVVKKKNTCKFGNYGKIIVDAKTFKNQFGQFDKTLYVFAHGNVGQFGPFNTENDLFNFLKDELKAFSPGKKNTYFKNLVLYACHSSQFAQGLAGLLRNHKWEKIAYFKVHGTNQRAFLDLLHFQIRIAKSNNHADTLDDFIKKNPKPNKDKYLSAFNNNCVKVGSGFSSYEAFSYN